MEKLFPKAALFQPDNAGGSEFQLEIIPENQIPGEAEEGKNAQNDGYGNENEGQEFDRSEERRVGKGSKSRTTQNRATKARKTEMEIINAKIAFTVPRGIK